MAHPFGGHPTFGKYLLWANKEHGFRAQSGIASDASGKPHTVTKISKPGGPSVVVPGVSQDEYLTPSLVGYLDRRLGIMSPWFSVDDNGENLDGNSDND